MASSTSSDSTTSTPISSKARPCPGEVTVVSTASSAACKTSTSSATVYSGSSERRLAPAARAACTGSTRRHGTIISSCQCGRRRCSSARVGWSKHAGMAKSSALFLSIASIEPETNAGSRSGEFFNSISRAKQPRLPVQHLIKGRYQCAGVTPAEPTPGVQLSDL